MDSTRFSTRSRIKMLAAVGLGLVGGVSATRGVFALNDDASPEPGPSGETHSIVIHALEFGYELPESIPSGWTRVTLINDGAEIHHAQLIAVPAGQTVDDVMAVFAADGEAALGKLTLAGGPGSAEPGRSSEAVIWLDPGQYVITCFVTSPDGMPHIMKGMVAALTVTEATDATEPPAADFQVSMLDFAFAIPQELAEGPTTIEILNDGTEAHEFAVLKLNEGVTPEMFAEFMANMGAESTPDEAVDGGHVHGTPAAPPALPFKMSGGLQAIAPGTKGYAIIDLTPATYMAICFVPSLANGGAPHAMLGMVASFTVA
jgi:hypothetical protein